MKNANKFGLWIVGITVLLIAFVDLASDTRVDWHRTYDQRDKIPYGLYIAHEELPRILGEDVHMEDFQSMNYESLKKFLPGKEQSSMVFIVDNIYEGKEVALELLDFVERGGEVFLSSNSLPSELLDTLGVKQDYHYPYVINEVVDMEDRPFSLADGTTAYYKDLDYPGLFTQLDSADTRIVGSFAVQDKDIPDFIEIKRGKGRFLLHLEPLMFTNYYLLQPDNFQYAAKALKLLSRKQIYWYDATFKNPGEAHTPLRVFLQHRGLRQAWYLLLFGLILFLLFKSKREQRAVEVVEPEPNLSKEFARTIATLYYESGNPGNLVQKKVEYFLYDLRTYFQLDILRLEEEDFARQLAGKSGVSIAECTALIQLLLRYRKVQAASDSDLLALHREIEEFKHKANML